MGSELTSFLSPALRAMRAVTLADEVIEKLDTDRAPILYRSRLGISLPSRSNQISFSIAPPGDQTNTFLE